MKKPFIAVIRLLEKLKKEPNKLQRGFNRVGIFLSKSILIYLTLCRLLSVLFQLIKGITLNEVLGGAINCLLSLLVSAVPLLLLFSIGWVMVRFQKKFPTLTGNVFLVIGIPAAIVFLATFLIKGGVWLASEVLPWLSVVAGWFLVIDLLILLPLGIFKKTRAFSGIGLLVSSFAYGLTLWFLSLILVYCLWGGLAVFLGFFLIGVGNMPLALLATSINGQWAMVGELLSLFVGTYVARLLGLLFTKHMGFSS